MQKYYTERNQEPPHKGIGAFRTAYRSEEGSLPYAKTHYFRRDERQYEDFEKVLGKRNMPQTLAEFQEIKYNEKEEFELLNRERNTISDIKDKDWNPTFKQKAVDTYYEFRNDGIELTDHGVARLLDRFANQKVEIKDICNNKPFNFIQNDGRRIKYYDKIAVVYLKDTDEVNTVIKQNNVKEEWNEI